ncbi:MAG: NADH/ubiquinone/plastoquinone (complex I), partial [Candidatus Omnitrophica bacterium]|nr:NADH/ubiquinone/plastoquinone (complex I) [Candidatus Omnitrophota bacterium]
MMMNSNIIPFFVAIPLAGAFLISLIGKKIKKFPDTIGVLTSLALTILSLLAVRLYNMQGILTYSVGGWRPPIGIGLVLDGLAAFMLVTVNLVAFCIVVYSISYMEKFTAKWKFYTLFFLMLGGMNGVIIAGDIFNLFVFLEIA